MILCDEDGDEIMLILTGTGTEIASAETDGDGYRVQWGPLGTDLNFTGTDGDGDKCLSPRRTLTATMSSE